jgi:protein SCO1/2
MVRRLRLRISAEKFVAVTFIYTACTSTCPVLTPMMSFVQDQLGRDFGRNIVFVSITVDPERDTPLVLKEYATSFGANLSGWSFLTGSPAAIRDVTRRYGVVASKNISGDVDHTFLTSIVDQHGILRLQYAGVRFDPEEFKRDLVSLLIER